MENNSQSISEIKNAIYYLKNYRYLKKEKLDKNIEHLNLLNSMSYGVGGGITHTVSRNDGMYGGKQMKDYIYAYLDELDRINDILHSDTTKYLKKVIKAINMVWLCNNDMGYILKRYYVDNDCPKQSNLCDELYIGLKKYYILKKDALKLYEIYYNSI